MWPVTSQLENIFRWLLLLLLLCHSCAIVRSYVYYTQHNSLEFYCNICFPRDFIVLCTQQMQTNCYFQFISLKKEKMVLRNRIPTIRGKLERAHHSTNSNDKRNVLVHRSLALSGNAGIIMFIIICFRFLCQPVSYARNGNNRKQRTRHDIRFFSDDLPLFWEYIARRIERKKKVSINIYILI